MAQHDRPNILWLMTDEQRTDSLGCYGSPWARTPNLDRLAGEGALFRHAYTPAPVCVPARASLLTARYPCHTGVWWNHTRPDRELDHLTRVLTEAGYRTATFGKQHYMAFNRAFETEESFVLTPAVHYFHYAPEYDEAEHGVVRYPGENRRWVFAGRFPEPAERTSEAQAVQRAIRWLDDHPREQPFLLRVSLNGPHTPVAPPEPFDRCIRREEVTLPEEAEALPSGAPRWTSEWLSECAAASRLSREQIERMRACYYGEVAFLDQQLGVLLDGMRERGLLGNTIVAFVSDHGTHLGDYGLVQKQTFYEPVASVPFFFRAPGRIPGGQVHETPVSTLSLLPTLLDLAGLEVPGGGDGPSLASALRRGEEPAHAPIFSEFSLTSFDPARRERLVMVREGDWKLSLRMDPRPCDGQLCNLPSDPHERTNLFGRPEHAAIQAGLTRQIRAHLSDCQGVV